jgi:hypothetical protein
MKRSTVVIAGLFALLVGSNALWLYALVDAGVSHSYLQSSHATARATAVQALGLLPEVARPGISRQDLIEAAQRMRPGSEAYEKEGFVWIGDIGLRFDGTGRLIEARAAVEPF